MTLLKSRLQRQPTSIHANNSGAQTSQEESQIEKLEIPMSSKTSLPSAQIPPAINSVHRTCDRVKALIRMNSIFLHLKSKIENSRKCVSELHDANSTHHGRYICELGNCRGNDKGEGPVDGNHEYPHDLSPLGGELWATEQILDDVLIDDFDTNVAVQSSRDDSTDHIESVGHGLRPVRIEALVGWVVGELALLRVDDQSINKICEEDENLSNKLGLDFIKALRISDINSQYNMAPPVSC